MTYKVGTHINFTKQAKRREFIEDLQNSLFWAGCVVMFLWCIFS
jgi:hypothetical protein